MNISISRSIQVSRESKEYRPCRAGTRREMGKERVGQSERLKPKVENFRIFLKVNEKIKNLNKTDHRHLLGSFHWLPS